MKSTMPERPTSAREYYIIISHNKDSYTKNTLQAFKLLALLPHVADKNWQKPNCIVKHENAQTIIVSFHIL